jgi:hypothetical protein
MGVGLGHAYMRVGAVAVCCCAALLPRVCMRCAPAVICVYALRACCVCVGPMPIRHERCASAWACVGQRHFVPRTYLLNKAIPRKNVDSPGRAAALCAYRLQKRRLPRESGGSPRKGPRPPPPPPRESGGDAPTRALRSRRRAAATHRKHGLGA